MKQFIVFNMSLSILLLLSRSLFAHSVEQKVEEASKDAIECHEFLAGFVPEGKELLLAKSSNRDLVQAIINSDLASVQALAKTADLNECIQVTAEDLFEEQKKRDPNFMRDFNIKDARDFSEVQEFMWTYCSIAIMTYMANASSNNPNHLAIIEELLKSGSNPHKFFMIKPWDADTYTDISPAIWCEVIRYLNQDVFELAVKYGLSIDTLKSDKSAPTLADLSKSKVVEDDENEDGLEGIDLDDYPNQSIDEEGNTTMVF